MNSAAPFIVLVITTAACGEEILPASTYEARCQVPQNDLSSADSPGTLLDEQLWLRSWIDDTYLWYREVPRKDPNKFATAIDYNESAVGDRGRGSHAAVAPERHPRAVRQRWPGKSSGVSVV